MIKVVSGCVIRDYFVHSIAYIRVSRFIMGDTCICLDVVCAGLAWE